MAKALLAMGSATAILSSRSISHFNRSPSLLQSKQTVFHNDLCLLFPVWNLFPPVPLGAVAVACRRNFSIRATNGVTDSGSVYSSLIRSMEKKIKEQLPAESVAVKDAYGDGRHVSIDVISSAFEGQSTLNRQRMVYKVIWEELQSTVHAVDQMTTRTPMEASA